LDDDSGKAHYIQRLGLWFGPHVGWGHSDSCVYPGTNGEFFRKQYDIHPRFVRFVWPEGANSVRVNIEYAEEISNQQASSENGLRGEYDLFLKDSNKPCRILIH
jgi:hypothetical protein